MSRAPARSCPPRRRRAQLDQERLLATIDTIYEAALDAELWPHLLRQLTDTLGGSASVLFFPDVQKSRIHFITAGGVDQDLLSDYTQYYVKHDPWLHAGRDLAPGEVVTGSMLVPIRELVRTEYYADFLRRAEQHWLLSTVVEAKGSLRSAISIYRPRHMEDFSQQESRVLAALVPHLQRTLRLARLRARCQAVDNVLDRLSVGVILSNARGRVCFLNRKAEEMLAERSELSVGLSSLQAASPADTAALRKAISQAAERVHRASDKAEDLLLRGRAAQSALHLQIMPLNRYVPLFPVQEATVAILVTESEAAWTVDADTLTATYDLTPAEARVVCGLVSGKTVAEIAHGLGTREGTVRNQLKRAFLKTGARRQAELVQRVLATSPLVVAQ